MEIDEQFFEHYSEDYTQGFNHASILADHYPEMLSEIVPENNLDNDYFTGFFDFKNYYRDQQINKDLEELEALRNSNTKDLDRELE